MDAIRRTLPDDVRRRLDAREPLVFVDTRNPTAWAESDVRIPGAIRIPYDQIDQNLHLLPKGRPIVTYCT